MEEGEEGKQLKSYGSTCGSNILSVSNINDTLELGSFQNSMGRKLAACHPRLDSFKS